MNPFQPRSSFNEESLRELASSIKELGVKFNITRKANKDFVYKNIKFEDNHRKFNYNESVNALSLKEFEEYFSKTNLEILEVFGDYNLKEFKATVSPRLIILFQKKIK